jgi:lysozyme family protein
MARFDDAVNITLQWEGGYVNDPADPGGETNFGISKRDHPNVDIKNLTVDQAKGIYKQSYWKDLYGEITSQVAGNKLFDMGVNIGVGTAVRLLQFALAVTVDGIFGVNTLAAVNNAGESILAPYKQALAQHYQDLVVRNPNLSKFLNGWLRRANS